MKSNRLAAVIVNKLTKINVDEYIDSVPIYTRISWRFKGLLVVCAYNVDLLKLSLDPCWDGVVGVPSSIVGVIYNLQIDRLHHYQILCCFRVLLICQPYDSVEIFTISRLSKVFLL